MYTWKNKKSGAKGTCTPEEKAKMQSDKMFKNVTFKPVATKTVAAKPTVTAPVKK